MDDLIDGMVKMMNSGIEFTGPVNIGNTDEFSILELRVNLRLFFSALIRVN